MDEQRKTAGDLTAAERARRWQAIQRAATWHRSRNRQERRALERAQRRQDRRTP